MRYDEIEIGALLPEVRDEISYRRVMMTAAATWDYFPGHHDPDYARRHGHPNVFVNTMHFMGFVDRVVTDWAGPLARVVRRKVSLARSIYAGDTMVGNALVVGKRDGTLVDLEVTVTNQDGDLCCPAEVTISL